MRVFAIVGSFLFLACPVVAQEIGEFRDVHREFENSDVCFTLPNIKRGFLVSADIGGLANALRGTNFQQGPPNWFMPNMTGTVHMGESANGVAYTVGLITDINGISLEGAEGFFFDELRATPGAQHFSNVAWQGNRGLQFSVIEGRRLQWVQCVIIGNKILFRVAEFEHTRPTLGQKVEYLRFSRSFSRCTNNESTIPLAPRVDVVPPPE